MYVDVCKYIVYTLYQWYPNIKPDQSLVYLFLVPTISSAVPVPIACHAILVTVRGLERGHLLRSEEQARVPCLHVLVVFPRATSISSNSSMLTHLYASWIRLTISELVSILWLKASPNWNWQNFGDQWGKFLHFLGRTRIPGWKNILFFLAPNSLAQHRPHKKCWPRLRQECRSLDWSWRFQVPVVTSAPLILVDLLHASHVNGTKLAMAAMRILCFTDITSVSWNPMKANCDQTVEPFFLISVLTRSQTYLAHPSSFTNGPFFETNCVQIRWRRHSDDLCHSIILCIYHVLVGGFNPSEKDESQLGWLFPIYGKS